MSDVALLEDIASLAPNEIQLTVLADMRLVISPQEIARAGEHNSAYFNIIQQPVSLDGLPCRAEIKCADGTTFYVLVSDGAFLLTNDITIHGTGNLQLVYADGAVSHKTQIAQYYVAQSIYAVDPSSPDFIDGLAQLQGLAFANVTYDNPSGLLAFYNINMIPLGSVLIAGGTGGVPDVPDVPGAYARTRTGGGDAAWTDFLTLRVAGLDSPAFQGSPTLTPTPIAGTASPVLANTEFVARDFLPRSGGQLSGPLICTTGGSLTNMGLAIGDNATGFYRSGNVLVLGISGAFILQYTVDSMMMAAQIVMGNQRITTLADATADQDALNRRTGDARYLQPTAADQRYLQLTGGTLSGTLITRPGGGANDLALAIGDPNTGFHRGAAGGAGADLMFLVAGFPLMVLTGTREAIFTGPVSMGLNKIFNIADATQANDALNLQTGDRRYLQMSGGNMAGPLGLYAPPTLPNDAVPKQYVDDAVAGVSAPSAFRTNAYLPNELTLTTTAQTFLDINFPMPPTGLRNILVTINPAYASTDSPGATSWQVIYATGLIAYESSVMAYKFTADPTSMIRSIAQFTAAVDTTSGQVRVLLTARLLAAGGPLIQVGVGGTIAPTMRTLVTVQDLGPVGVEEIEEVANAA
jgi:hypothetical protein